MNDEATAATKATISITITKYIQYIAVLSAGTNTDEICDMIGLPDLVKASINVYTELTKIIGEIIGKVIFQKVSQPVAPSI